MFLGKIYYRYLSAFILPLRKLKATNDLNCDITISIKKAFTGVKTTPFVLSDVLGNAMKNFSNRVTLPLFRRRSQITKDQLGGGGGVWSQAYFCSRRGGGRGGGGGVDGRL